MRVAPNFCLGTSAPGASVFLRHVEHDVGLDTFGRPKLCYDHPFEYEQVHRASQTSTRCSGFQNVGDLVKFTYLKVSIRSSGKVSRR